MKKILVVIAMLFSFLIYGQEKSGAKQFWENLQKQCGKSFIGEVKEGAANDTFREKKLVMHVRNCDENTIRIPFFCRRQQIKNLGIDVQKRPYSIET